MQIFLMQVQLVPFRHVQIFIRPNKKISVFSVTGRKILDRVGTQFFLNYFFSGKKIICIWKGKMPLKYIKTIFFPENLKKILCFTCKFR